MARNKTTNIEKEKRKAQYIENGDTYVPYRNAENSLLKKQVRNSFSKKPFKNENEIISSKNSKFYYEDRNRQVFKMALLGLKLSEIANVLGVGKATIKKWMTQYPAFKESYEAGKTQASSNVAVALYQIATGYSHPEQKIFMNKVKEYDPDTGKVIREYNEPLVVDTIKHHPPNFAAINKFLSTKFPNLWKEGKDEVEHSFVLPGSENHKALEEVSEEELRLMEKIGMKEAIKGKKKKSKKE